MSTITEVHQPAAIGMRGHAKQLSSTDSKIKNIAKTAFQKIAAFFAYCQSNCKSAYATLKAKCLALKARITSFFKKSDSSSQPSHRSGSFSGERAQRNSVESRSRSPSPVNGRQAQVSVPELTPQFGALIPYQPNPVLQRLNAAMQEVSNKSLRSLVDNNFELPLPPMEPPLATLHPTMLLAENASQPEIPVATGASVDAEPVLASAISFAQRQNRRNTPPFANVEQFSQLSPRQRLEISQQLTGNNPYSTAGGQTSQPSGSNVPTYIFGASAAVVAVAAVLKNDPALLTKLASGATTAAQSAQPVLAKAFEAATNGARTIADAVKSAVANAHFNNGKLEIDMA